MNNAKNYRLDFKLNFIAETVTATAATVADAFEYDARTARKTSTAHSHKIMKPLMKRNPSIQSQITFNFTHQN